jgi:hypothetical protein
LVSALQWSAGEGDCASPCGGPPNKEVTMGIIGLIVVILLVILLLRVLA